jgi:hypothetical protein
MMALGSTDQAPSDVGRVAGRASNLGDAQHRPALVDAQLDDILVAHGSSGPSVLPAQNLRRGITE